MKRIYYYDKLLVIGSKCELSPEINRGNYIVANSIEQAKLDFFSDSAKPVILFTENEELDFSGFFANFVVIEAGGGIVRNDREELLMIFRNGRWDLPKGKLEMDERIEDCALREVCEECGIGEGELSLDEFFDHTYHIYKIGQDFILKKTWWWLMSYDGTGGLLTPQTEEGIERVEWISEATLSDFFDNTYRTIGDLLNRLSFRSY